jgi:hypothetical protein
MFKTSDSKIALVALIALAAWLLIGLPLLYLPIEGHVHGEILGVKYGEWLLFAATMGLWWATWRLVRSAENTAERQLRAYIVAEPQGVNIHGPENAVSVSFQIIVKNTGQTPAHDLTIVSKTELLEHPIKMPFNFILISGPDPSRAVLGAGQKKESDSRAKKPFNGDEMMIAKEPEAGARIYTWGCVTYRDVFGHQHYTNFCSSLLFDDDGTAFSHTSEHHNDAS